MLGLGLGCTDMCDFLDGVFQNVMGCKQPF